MGGNWVEPSVIKCEKAQKFASISGHVAKSFRATFCHSKVNMTGFFSGHALMWFGNDGVVTHNG